MTVESTNVSIGLFPFDMNKANESIMKFIFLFVPDIVSMRTCFLGE